MESKLGAWHDIETDEMIVRELTAQEIAELEGTDETPTAD
jgi:hypothetical protein